MDRLASFDVTRYAESPPGKLVMQVAFGTCMAGAVIALRFMVDMAAPGTGPFAMVYPPVVIATLYGRLVSGITALVISLAWAWWYVLPPEMSFAFTEPTDRARLIINCASITVILFFVEAFRRAVRNATQERDAQIERRVLLMNELEHRSRNNFALVSSLLSLQSRRHDSADVREALDRAISRVDTFARAYESLKYSDADTALIPMSKYVGDVVTRVSAGAFPENVEIAVEADEALLPQRAAVAVGLFINEALTNCAKYAFPQGRGGSVLVSFAGAAEQWELRIRDDGVGSAEEDQASANGTGMGQGLMGAFARQAEADYAITFDETGRTAILHHPAREQA